MSVLKQRMGLKTDRFILFVGGADPRKNHRKVLEAASLIRGHLDGRTLLLVGSPTHPFGSYERTAASYGLAAHVLCPGRLSREDLRLLYSCADLFVPVITSNDTALGEVAGDAAVVIDPHDARALADSMIRVLENDSFRVSLREKGFLRVKDYRWSHVAARTLSLYSSLCR
jgi:glycosyltransferase involved in cell wall biosynthesis